MIIEKSKTILLDKEEFTNLCKPGEGDNTCIWAMVGERGFECSYYNRPTALVARWCQNLTSAKRNGCEVIKKLNLGVGYTEAKTLEQVMEEPK